MSWCIYSKGENQEKTWFYLYLIPSQRKTKRNLKDVSNRYNSVWRTEMFVNLTDSTFSSGLFILMLSDLFAWTAVQSLTTFDPTPTPLTRTERWERASESLHRLTDQQQIQERKSHDSPITNPSRAEPPREPERRLKWPFFFFFYRTHSGWPLTCQRQKADAGREAAKHAASENHRRLNQQFHMKEPRGGCAVRRVRAASQQCFVAAS